MSNICLNHKKEVLNLYRISLKFAMEVGYVPGDTRTETYIPRDYNKLELKKRRKIIINLDPKDLGAFVASNIRKMYKDNKKLNDPVKIKESIDYGYHFIRNIPIFLFNYNKEYLIDLWCYN